MIVKYNTVNIMELSVDDILPDIIPSDVTNIRAEIIASDIQKRNVLERNGFYFADRTLKTSIPLKELDESISKLSRFKSDTSAEYTDEIFEIAKNSFPTDRRFHINKEYDSIVAEDVISGYINNAQKSSYPLITVLNKNNIIGFAILKPTGDDYFVYLAAVLQKFQKTGAAVSLYISAYKHAYLLGAKRLNGRISTLNTSVMNIYGMLHAKFSEPYDIFIKKIG